MIGDACGKLLGKGGTLWIQKAHTEFKRRLKKLFGLSKKKKKKVCKLFYRETTLETPQLKIVRR